MRKRARKGEVSLLKRLKEKDRRNLIEAVKGDKYWNILPLDRSFVYVVALSRARVRGEEGFYARATALERVLLPAEIAKFCRKHRVLLVDVSNRRAVCVLTWRAFTKIMKRHGEKVHEALSEGVLPPYINNRILRKLVTAHIFKIPQAGQYSLKDERGGVP